MSASLHAAPLAAPLPVNLITGFLGSGKTTLLRRLLDQPTLADTAVLVNEFGEIGLDHHLLNRVDTETVLLRSGCVCCTIRDDLGAAMRELLSRRARGTVPAFRRLAIESTGLADPVPILATVLTDRTLRHQLRLGNVVTTVDAVNGLRQCEEQPEFARQVAVADRLVLTKTDLADAATTARLGARLAGLNGAVPVVEAMAPNLDVAALVLSDTYDPACRGAEVHGWLREHPRRSLRADAPHAEDLHSFCLVFDRPLDWTMLGIWLSMLVQAHGEKLLRIKGVLNVGGAEQPVIINGVQHLMHPPQHLDAWPDDDRRSRIVFILRGLSRAAIEQSFSAFLGPVPVAPR